MAIQIQLRRGTTAEWEATDPVLAEGELGYDTTTGGFKVGNGVDDWTALSYNTGPAGADGADGTVWYYGAGAPSDAVGVNGDFYLNTTNGDVYTKAAGTWGSSIGNIKGPTGATGATGSQGPQGETGATGAKGDTGSATAASDTDYTQLASKPTAPASGHNKLYFKTDGKPYYEDSGGTETEVGSGTGGTITVKEVDNSPTVTPVSTIKVSNGTLTDNGDGSVSIVTSTGTIPCTDSSGTDKFLILDLNRVPCTDSSGNNKFMPLAA